VRLNGKCSDCVECWAVSPQGRQRGNRPCGGADLATQLKRIGAGVTELPRTAATTGLDVSRRRSAVVVTFADLTTVDGATGWAGLQFQAWARDADLYAVVFDFRAGNAGHLGAGSAAVCDLIWRLECFAKPSLCLLPGAVSPMAVALALAGTHRIAGLHFRGRLADLAAGALPPGITLHALARLPQGVGAYLLLTGQTLGAADALALGLATHVMAAAGFAALVAGLADADPIDPLLDGVPGAAVTPAAANGGGLQAQMPLMVRYFAADRLDVVVASLSQAAGPDAVWAQAALAALKAVPSRLGDVALAALRRAGQADVRQALILTDTANQALARGGDLTDIEAVFRTPPDTVLTLPTRAEMQSLRRLS
jgi:enoyl-CoA hydratase/carnithine racemase